VDRNGKARAKVKQKEAPGLVEERKGVGRRKSGKRRRQEKRSREQSPGRKTA